MGASDPILSAELSENIVVDAMIMMLRKVANGIMCSLKNILRNESLLSVKM